jgi:phosphonopyruvate decarboxylase
MRRDDVIGCVCELAAISSAAIFAGNGNCARAVAALTAPGDRVFPMVGSMGLAPTIAAGWSNACGQRAIAIEGDANFLMGLSALPAVAQAARGALVHVVLDNQVCETTGGQATLSASVNAAGLARAAGYARGASTDSLERCRQLISDGLDVGGVSLVHVPTVRDVRPQHPRVPLSLPQIAARFVGVAHSFRPC